MVCAAEDLKARKEGLHPRASPKKQEAQKFQGRYVKLPVPKEARRRQISI